LRHVAASVLIAERERRWRTCRERSGDASRSITLSTYAHEFARVERADRARGAMEAAFGGRL
jgi:hypothetical protein